MHPFVNALQQHFLAHQNPEKAEPMARYMKNHFPFLGIQSPERRKLLREVIQVHNLPDKEDLQIIIRELWALPEREFQAVSLDILQKYKKYLDETHIPFLEELIVTKSWWDSVDGIVPTFLGGIFLKHPEMISIYIPKWTASENIWLQRAAILFQLKYKQQTDEKLLFSIIGQLKSSKEFFIQKAIGWVLREYAKTSPHVVWEYVQNNELAPLSKREAIKHIRSTMSTFSD
ncbi:DNA alkylation repair protein [Bacillus pseudomycoides]|uniref:DNA alkylation repair protein n=1 Tax=Bacillus pseudomycoides TaxID=64104 RepID=A0AA91ZSY9_9BACI|nr:MULTISPECIES: DNA alkylation repair protein [Bacillus]PEB50532.1 DNA alkylation repair protein [Bacillus sp. AFS098217]PED81984.1 DNA alkylation repair protein [Bacillus pseudomycoides]PEU05672.1 DNA alkylation repair protein [Bacillus sp. AFS019443]PEU10495.1 DNA alkylation repair protein [Bacillus sp. AFS014408]PFW61153.1 DNA alkylation repair protein [Bacillus sp. AFS075034]